MFKSLTVWLVFAYDLINIIIRCLAEVFLIKQSIVYFKL